MCCTGNPFYSWSSKDVPSKFWMLGTQSGKPDEQDLTVPSKVFDEHTAQNRTQNRMCLIETVSQYGTHADDLHPEYFLLTASLHSRF